MDTSKCPKMTESKKKAVTAGTFKLHFMAALNVFQIRSFGKGTKVFFSSDDDEKVWQTLENLLVAEPEKSREEPITLRGNVIEALIGQILQTKLSAFPAAASINGTSYDHVFIDLLLSLGLSRADAVVQSKIFNEYLKSIAWLAARQIYTDSEQSAKKESKKMTLTIAFLQRFTLMLESSLPDKSADIQALAESFKQYEKVKVEEAATEAATEAVTEAATDAATDATTDATTATVDESTKPAKKSAKKEPKVAAKKEPKADKPKADKPKADKPKADKPKADKPKADKPKAAAKKAPKSEEVVVDTEDAEEDAEEDAKDTEEDAKDTKDQ